MQTSPSSTSALVTGLRHISKLVTRSTEMSHLHYSGAELVSLTKALGTRRNGHETELVGYQVKYLDPASFRIVAREVFAVMRDLVASGKVALIFKMIIGYHHKIGNEASHPRSFLSTLEGAGCEYQLEAGFDPAPKVGQSRDILIWTYRPGGLD